VRLGELALEAGLPEGLFQVIVGSGSVVGQRFVSHPDVRKVVFTGRPRSVSRWLRAAPEL
jgi:betaine-aldehyde dehydrogenase